jgi:hypothetical protein
MMTTLLSPEITTVPELSECCDSCGAAAKLEVILATGGFLTFCGHHANAYAGELAPLTSRAVVEAGFTWTGVRRP